MASAASQAASPQPSPAFVTYNTVVARIVFISGGSGFIGQAVIRELLRRDYRVHAPGASPAGAYRGCPHHLLHRRDGRSRGAVPGHGARLGRHQPGWHHPREPIAKLPSRSRGLHSSGRRCLHPPWVAPLHSHVGAGEHARTHHRCITRRRRPGKRSWRRPPSRGPSFVHRWCTAPMAS